jgi:hypothetical protein
MGGLIADAASQIHHQASNRGSSNRGMAKLEGSGLGARQNCARISFFLVMVPVLVETVLASMSRRPN